MKKKTEKAYFNEEWDEMVSHLKKFIKTGDQAELHRFRVQIKKLRAMLHLLDSITDKNRLTNDFKPVKKIFRQGGVIRDAYLHLLLSSKYQMQNEEFILEQVNGMERNMLEFKQQAKKYLKTIREVHDELEKDLRAVTNDSVNEFYKSQLEYVAAMLNELQFDDSLHDCRKRIKDLIYNRKMAGKALDGKLNINNDYLDKLQDSIGNWHDNELAMQLFSSDAGKNKPIVTKIKRKNTTIKRSIGLLAKDFWDKAMVTDKDIVNTLVLV